MNEASTPIPPPASESAGAVLPAVRPPTVRSWRWGLELLLVFASVLAAFSLNGYQVRRQQQQRREQLLATMQADYEETLASLRRERADFQKAAEEFLRRLHSGEMPPLEPLQTASNYNADDTTSLLASGGYDLLDLDTIHQVKDVEGTARNVINYLTHCQQLSDSLILPNADRTLLFSMTRKPSSCARPTAGMPRDT